ncbi:MAG TPA: alpha-L-arabinofuranosidase C-terminal domain-containing protein [Microlunatus sp.]
MTDTARITIRDRVIGRVAPELYGQFLSRRKWVADQGLHDPQHPDADDSGLRGEVVDAIEELRPTVVRWPGGCTGTSYEWQQGVGPQDQRNRTVDWHFGYDVGNGFGTVEFVDFCRRIGAEPQINVTTGTESLRDALNWLEYCNGAGDSQWANLRRAHGRDEPLGVRYWQLGNEEWGDWEIGHLDPQSHAQRTREWAKAIRKLDPTVSVLGVGALRADLAVDWNLPLLRAAWGQLDFLTQHVYWPFDPNAEDGDYNRVLSGPYNTEAVITAMSGLIELVAREKSGGQAPRLAFTEWNCVDSTRKEMSPQWRPTSSMYRMVDALAVASFLNVMQRHSDVVGLANFAQTINVVGALLVTDDAVMKETVYWPLQMQREHSGGWSVAADVSCPQVAGEAPDRSEIGIPALDVSVTADADRLWISMINRSRDEIAARLELDQPISAQATRYLLHHEDPLVKNTLEDPDAVRSATDSISLGTDPIVTLPPSSYMIIEVPLDQPLAVLQ